MAGASEQASTPGFIERSSHLARNLFVGSLLLEVIFAPVVSAGVIGAEILGGLGSDYVYRSEKQRRTAR